MTSPGDKTFSKLTSPTVGSHVHGAACLSFYYWLNGNGLHPTLALYGYLVVDDPNYPKGRKIDISFKLGGHKGNYWKRKTIEIPTMNSGYKVLFVY